LIATLFSIPAMIILLGLGIWQLQRLEWKTEQITLRQQALMGDPVDLTEVVDFRALDFQAVRVEGRFLPHRSLFLYPRAMNKVAGVHILTPFKLTSGEVFVVNRGFVPSGGVAPKYFDDPVTDHLFNLTGILRTRFKKPYVIGDGVDPTGLIGWYDIPAMTTAFGVPLQPAIIEAGNSPHPDRPPSPGQTTTDLVNNHASYAFTWFCLAFAWLVIFVIFWRQQGTT
jgi:surfeit locus 1 family protein